METETAVIEKIQQSYMQKEVSKLDELKALDKKVKLPVEIFAYTYGSLSTLVFGAGMCFAMEIIGSSMVFGIGLGLLGAILMLTTHPLYKAMLTSRKNKYKERVVELANSLLNK